VQKNSNSAFLNFEVIDLCSFLHFEHCRGQTSESIRYEHDTLYVDISHWVGVQFKRTIALPCFILELLPFVIFTL
jgi:hypothetical protein